VPMMECQPLERDPLGCTMRKTRNVIEVKSIPSKTTKHGKKTITILKKCIDHKQMVYGQMSEYVLHYADTQGNDTRTEYEFDNDEKPRPYCIIGFCSKEHDEPTKYHITDPRRPMYGPDMQSTLPFVYDHDKDWLVEKCSERVFRIQK